MWCLLVFVFPTPEDVTRLLYVHLMTGVPDCQHPVNYSLRTSSLLSQEPIVFADLDHRSCQANRHLAVEAVHLERVLGQQEVGGEAVGRLLAQETEDGRREDFAS